MPAPTLTTVATLKVIGFRENHQAVFEIKIGRICF
jgi:hypothetical protein